MVGNLRRLQELKADRGVGHPELSMSFVMMRSTIDEVPQFLRLANELGARGAHLLHVVPYDGLDLESETLDREPERCNRILDEACALSAELGMLLRTPKRFELPRDSAPDIPANVDQDRKRHDLGRTRQDEARRCCPFPWHFIGIRCDGGVQPCGWWFQGPSMGNVYRQGFRAIWEGDNWTNLREILSGGQLAKDCISCPAAGPGDVQRSESFGIKDPL